MASSVFRPHSRISTYGFDVARQQRELNIEKWDMGFHADRRNFKLLPLDEEETLAIAAHFSSKPITIERDALAWYRANRSLLPEGATNVELKCRVSGRLIEKLNGLNDPTLVGMDKAFQQNLLREHGCEQFFLTVQLLAGLFSRWSFIGLHGAASVLSLLTPVNVLLAMDLNNLSREMQLVRCVTNMKIHGIPTIGRLVLQPDFADHLAMEPRLFEETILAALENRKNARAPSVAVQEIEHFVCENATRDKGDL